MKKIILIIIMLLLVTGCSDKNNDASKMVTEDKEVQKEESSVDTTLINDTTLAQTDDEVVSYIEKVEEGITTLTNNANDTSLKDKLKNTFISLTDFIFYGGEIKGRTFSSLTDEAKEKVLTLYESIDSKINDKFPGYKETIKDTATKTYTKVVDKAVDLKNSIVEKYRNYVGDEGYENTVDSYEEGKNNLKDSFSNTKDYIVEKGAPIKDYVKDKAGSAKDKISSWYQEFKENN